jgi:hypothetical protein
LPSSSSPLTAIFLKKFDEIINRLDKFDGIIDRLDGMQTKIAAAQDELTPLLAILKHDNNDEHDDDDNNEYDNDDAYDEYDGDDNDEYYDE